MVRIGSMVGDLLRIAELQDEVVRLKHELMLRDETPIERELRIAFEQYAWDEQKAWLEESFQRGYNRGYTMPPRPV